MPLQATSGAASYDAFGGGAAAGPQYIEDVFSTWLYTGAGGTLPITNGIDLAGKGGLVWVKRRSSPANNNALMDTVRGLGPTNGAWTLVSDDPTSQFDNNTVTAFNNNGFTLGSSAFGNSSGSTYASWTFRKQEKFFDVVTWTGNGANRTIAHNLGSVPGCIIVKRTDASADWQVYHRSLANTQYMVLNSSAAAATGATRWNSTTPTGTVFSLGTDATVNASGGTYVAYIFAHNAGGFGLSGTDNVISCGSYTGTGADGNFINLGYEPQWIMIKKTNEDYNWSIFDNMRGVATGGNDAILYANTSGAEVTPANVIDFNATGFTANTAYAWTNDPGDTYIYIAIRRGPMKVPETGTSVFSPIAVSSPTGTTQTTNFVIDSQWKAIRDTSNSLNTSVDDRLRGVSTTTTASGRYMVTSDTIAETTTNSTTRNWDNTGFQTSPYYNNWNMIYWSFRRAPGFFDQVCYTGNGATQTLNHNLGVAPELWIIKSRTDSGTSLSNWGVYAASLGLNQWARVNTAESFGDLSGAWTGATATTFSVGSPGAFPNDRNRSGQTYVAYLFASCPGVSKVGSYTGNGSSQTINCGFTTGARFVLIKRTNASGDWYVWDTARGIVAGNDPHISLNSTAAQVTSNDTIDTDSTGFVVNQVSATNVNVSSATYIFLAIA